MCANLFPLICNSSPDSDPPRAEENDRTRTVETADGLSRRAQSGVRCALLHASAHSVHAQKYTEHTTQSSASTSERDDSTRHIMARTRITSLKPHNAHAARERDAPVSLQYERQLCPCPQPPRGIRHRTMPNNRCRSGPHPVRTVWRVRAPAPSRTCADVWELTAYTNGYVSGTRIILVVSYIGPYRPLGVSYGLSSLTELPPDRSVGRRA